MGCYRIDTELKQDITLDDVESIGQLREYGERLAELIDWEAILAGTDEESRVDYGHKRLPQYAKQTLWRSPLEHAGYVEAIARTE